MKKVFIFSARIAKDLIKSGFRVIDIAENQKDKKRTVFIFKNTQKIREFLKIKWGLEIR